jgi:hypothetical protein
MEEGKLKMSMSTYVRGFRPADEKWKKMKKIWYACQEAGVDVPDEVDDFFDGDKPDEAGVEIKLNSKTGCKEWSDGNGRDGIEITLDNLPKNVTVIRFVNSW